MLARMLSLLSFFALPFLSMSQTCDIVRITPNAITAGADTKTTHRKVYIDKTGKHLEVTSETTCKFGYTNGIYYVLAGAPDSISRLYASEACHFERGIDAVAKKYMQQMSNALIAYWNIIRLKDSGFYRNNIKESDLTFFAFENGKPRAWAINFLPLSNNPTDNAKFQLFYADISKLSKVWPMGQYTEIQKEVLDSTTWKNKMPKDVILRLIEKQRHFDPDIIGKPYDVIEVTAKGARWLTPDRPGRISLK